MPASIRILEFCTANAGRSAKWEDTRGATEGQTELRVGAEWCLEKAPNLPPNFIGSKKGRAGMESGSSKMCLIVQGARALLRARVSRFPFRV